ncbi:MAG TPA: hypothetical protein VHR84_14880 [Terriglobales bacterium]|jgi:hypothetical protein|nr:hypothetical protein [Terriglobales bacterium]
MAHFTQLNIGSKEESKKPESIKSLQQKRKMMMEEKAVLFGSLVIICLTSGAVLLTTQGCSRSSEKPTSIAHEMPQSPAFTTPAPAAAAPAAEKKKPKRPAIVTYKDAASGLSFQYPRKYTIKTGNTAKEDLAGLGPVPMNFSEAGGKTLATIEVNNSFFPGTDLKTAFVNVSVNSTLDATECSQFSVPVHTEGTNVPASNMQIGPNDFAVVEDFDQVNAEQPAARYYHTYANGSCFEFALGIATDGNGDKEEVRAIDRDAVFAKLTKIVASAQIASTDETKPTVAPVEVGQAAHPTVTQSESAGTDVSSPEESNNDNH